MVEHLPARYRLVAAFAAVYLIWGSTYLAIRFAIETIPPFLMAGTRFLIAGTLLYVWQRARGSPTPEPVHWRTAAIVGGLLLVGGNGGVSWAEQFVPSGLAALLIATEPLWIVLIVWAIGESRPSLPILIGVVVGFGGVLLLVGPEKLAGGERVDPVGAVVLIGAALSWAMGSLYSRQAPQSPSLSLATAMSMLAGGALLLVVGAATGELPRLDIASVSLKSGLAVGYLVLFGSIVGLGSYLWLMKATTPARASTYAYVNPVVALLLGWLLASEALTPRSLVAAAVIVGAVALIVSKKGEVELGATDASLARVAPETRQPARSPSH